MMDTNNFPHKVGVGERESRIYSQMVAQRHYFMGHGIGRSGDISAVQPKAAGSSLILKLTKHLTKDAIKQAGYQDIKDLLILPQSTGMALTLCLLTLKNIKSNSKYVLWPRIDQKTCLKCIITANLIPVVIENIQEGDCITTNLELLKQKIEELGHENILCILSTTSCFAPRVPDKIQEISIICKVNIIKEKKFNDIKQFNIKHVINNAYGIQCTKIANMINQGHAFGSIDLVVQSTDKNFLVPVGGSIVFGYEKEIVQKVSQLYPGRGSAAPIIDLFITLLSMGSVGFKQLLSDRKDHLAYMKEKIKIFNQKYNERLLDTPKNSISIGITLQYFKKIFSQEYEQESEINAVTKLGSILYSKKVMGSRILTDKMKKIQCGIEFKNYGSHIDNYNNMPYMTIACSIGIQRNEIDQFFLKLNESFVELEKKYNKQKQLQQNQQDTI